jgi:phospholipid-binding lipoprotein MlaA
MLLLAVTLAGCATTGADPADPLEPINRAIFSFNDGIDAAVLKPVARGYRAVAPAFVRTGVANFFSNLDDVWISANNALQGKFEQGLGDFLRFAFNSTLGLFGAIDIASDMGLEKHNEDFGQTLGKWGLGPGPYLVLPFLGPSTVRDGISLLLIDARGDPVLSLDHVPSRNTTYTARAVSNREQALDATNAIEKAALDKYSYLRAAWLQRRRNLVHDGNPPPEPDEMDEQDEPKNEAPAAGKPGSAPVPSKPDPAVSVDGRPVMVGSGNEAAPLTTMY